MKKIISSYLIVVLMLMILVSCKGIDENKNSEVNSVKVTSETVIYHVLKDKEKYEALPKGKPFIIPHKYANGEIATAVLNVVQFGAIGDGVTDDTKAFDKAMYQAASKGGGVVFVPEGTYRFKQYLKIPSGVTLRGTWESPDINGNNSGTLFISAFESLGINGMPFICMESSTAIKNIAIYHENQTFENPKNISPTISTVGTITGATVDTVMLYNSYYGIVFGQNGCEVTTISNVYGTPLNIGVAIDFAPDISRIMNVKFSYEYYAQCGYKGAPKSQADVEKLKNTMLKDSTGFISERIDWHCIYNIKTRGLRVGFNLRKSSRTTALNNGWEGPPSGYLYGFEFTECETGILVDQTMYAGFQISNGKIEANKGTNPVAISISPTHVTSLFLGNIDFIGKPKNAIYCKGAGNYSISNCKIDDWSGEYAMVFDGGVASISQCEFKQDKPILKANASVESLAFIGNKTMNKNPKLELSELSDKKKVISSESLNIPVPEDTMYKPPMKIPSPAKEVVYDVMDFGTKCDGTDQTFNIQTALDKAGRDGGGIVYMAPGKYSIYGGLKIPKGVELRGAFESAMHTKISVGSIFYVYGDKGKANGLSPINLEEGSGITGINFYYPEQGTFGDYVAYPPTIMSMGKNTYLKYVILINSYYGADFGTHESDGHYISFLLGQTIKRGVFIGNNSTEGWIENTQFVPHYMHASKVPNKPSLEGGDFSSKWEKLLTALMEENEFFVLGYNEKENMFNNVSFGSKNAVRFIEQNGKSTNAEIIAQYTDATQVALKVEKAGKINFYSSWLCVAFAKQPMSYIEMDKNCGADITMFTSGGHGFPTIGYNIDGGKLTLVGQSIFDTGEITFKISGGETKVFASVLHNNTGTHIFQQGDGTIDFHANIVKHITQTIDNTLEFIVVEGDVSKIRFGNNIQTNTKY